MPNRVLIVDDSLLMRKMVGDSLTDSGWEVAGEAPQARRRHDGHRHAGHRRTLRLGTHHARRSRRQSGRRQRIEPNETHFGSDPQRRPGFHRQAVPAGTTPANDAYLRIR